jgi:uncharacterized protein YodC (DUF2158 family)
VLAEVSFKVGDIVQLKSGGPEMTVERVSSAGKNVYWCQWFAGRKLESGQFPADSLKPVQPSQS